MDFQFQEKQQYLTELKNKETELTVTKEAQEKLMSRIQTMESKLLCGGKNIIDHTNEQQRALQQRTQELLEQKVNGFFFIFFFFKYLFLQYFRDA